MSAPRPSNGGVTTVNYGGRSICIGFDLHFGGFVSGKNRIDDDSASRLTRTSA